jgi:MFS family permease
MSRGVFFTVLIAALGYFVDIYDLLLFGIVRVPSLRAIGVAEADLMAVGLQLLNYQMIGMVFGGIAWGILGDLRGRRSVLFGSILLYSVANIANAFVTDAQTYSWLRFIAGFGLAGELGAAITLVSEIMDKESRGYGTAIVASIGILGAVVASLIGDYFSWKVAYLVGGGMGLSLLCMRASMIESSMFHQVSKTQSSRGQFHLLFTSPKRLGRYLACIFIGLPIWYVVGILITFSPELAKALTVQGAISASKSIMWAYAGLSIGDLVSGFLSQKLKSRKKAVLFFLLLTLSLVVVYLNQSGWQQEAFYALCMALGFATGYWAIFITIAAEQFGTNIRATVATTVPNFVRGSVVPVTLAFEILKPQFGLINAVALVGFVVMSIGLISLYYLRETFGKDLNYIESL